MKNKILPGSHVLAAFLFLVMVFPAQALERVSYKADIRSIINDYCLNCHKPGGLAKDKTNC